MRKILLCSTLMLFVSYVAWGQTADRSQAGPAFATQDDSLGGSNATPAPAATAGEQPAAPKTSSAQPPQMPPIPPYLIKVAQLSAKFDDLNPKGWAIPYPTTGDTVIQDAGGVRTELAKHHIGFSIWNINGVYDNLATNGHHNPQVFNGQKPTFNGFEILFFTYNIPSQHLQFVIAGAGYNAAWKNLGPHALRLDQLAVHQDVFGGKGEWKAGYLTNDSQWAGGYTGGSVAGGTLGLNAVIAYEVGQNRTPDAVPAFDFKYRFTKQLYVRTGIQRSIPVGGAEEEQKENLTGFRPWSGNSKARALFINELGWQQAAMPGVKQTWVRVTQWYNLTKFPNYEGQVFTGQALPNTARNWAVSAAADHQIWQKNKYLAYQGLYGGATFQYAPPQENLYSQYYEARLYGFGLLPKRPLDMTTLLVNRTGFSSIVETYLRSAPANLGLPAGTNMSAGSLNSTQFGVPTYASTTSVTVAYMVHLWQGTNVNFGVMRTMHPTFAPQLRPSTVGVVNIAQFF